MHDTILESIRAVLIGMIFCYLIYCSKKLKYKEEGFFLIIIGFGLILFSSIIDITDNFESLNRFVIIGNTHVQAILEKFVGSLLGFVMITLGFCKWMPKINKLTKTQRQLNHSKKELKEMNEQLESKVKKRTNQLEKSKKELQEKNEELERFNKLALGRELKIIELKKKLKEK